MQMSVLQSVRTLYFKAYMKLLELRKVIKEFTEAIRALWKYISWAEVSQLSLEKLKGGHRGIMKVIQLDHGQMAEVSFLVFNFIPNYEVKKYLQNSRNAMELLDPWSC